MKKTVTVHVKLEDANTVTAMRREIDNLLTERKRLTDENTRLVMQRGYEVAMNAELIDICRKHRIDYRSGLDISTWDKETG